MVDSISLPITDVNLSLSEALQNMKRAGRSGLVWRRQSTEFSLITAADVVRGRRAKAKRLEDLPSKRIHVYTPAELLGIEALETGRHSQRRTRSRTAPDFLGVLGHPTTGMRALNVEVIGKTGSRRPYVDTKSLSIHLKGQHYGIFAAADLIGAQSCVVHTRSRLSLQTGTGPVGLLLSDSKMPSGR